LIEGEAKFLNEYSTFQKIRKKQKQILGILKRDDQAAFAKLSDAEVSQEVLRLFNVKATNAKPVAAAFCGALTCLGTSTFSDDAFQRAIVWGNCQRLARALPPGILAPYAVASHRYDFPLPAEPNLASLAIEADNITALRKLAESGVPFATDLLEEAIAKRKLAAVAFLVEIVPTSQQTLGLAVRSEEPRILQVVLESTTVDVNASVADDGSTALHVAASLGLLLATAVLLKQPAIEVDVQDDRGDSPWAIAQRLGHQEVADLIQQFRTVLNERYGE
jgi:hypothetical protein